MEPGEIVVVEQGEVRSIRENCVNPSSHLCIFEYIYFVRPDEDIQGLTGADSLGYLSLETLHQIAPDAFCGFCNGCFTGHYPISLQ